MTIDYSTRIGYGYIIDADTVASLTPEEEMEFYDSPYAFALDSNEPEDSPYFFGEMPFCLGPGTAMVIPETLTVNRRDIIDSFEHFFPELADLEPMTYVLSCVD